jgi:hypothetical protein
LALLSRKFRRRAGALAGQKRKWLLISDAPLLILLSNPSL